MKIRNSFVSNSSSSSFILMCNVDIGDDSKIFSEIICSHIDEKSKDSKFASIIRGAIEDQFGDLISVNQENVSKEEFSDKVLNEMVQENAKKFKYHYFISCDNNSIFSYLRDDLEECAPSDRAFVVINK